MRPLPFLALVFIAPYAIAQHCGYDFKSLIVIHPHAAGDSAVIKGLRITLLDSTNLPVVHYGRPCHLFRPNDDPKACEHDMRGRRCFPFAKDSYVLVIPNGLTTETMRVLIQDDDPGHYVDKRQERWQEGWAQQVVALNAFDSYRLCGTYDEDLYPHEPGRPSYHPVDVTLVKR